MRSSISIGVLLAVLVAAASAQEAQRALPLRPRSRSLIPDLKRGPSGQRLQPGQPRQAKPAAPEQFLPTALAELPNVVQEEAIVNREEPIVITKPEPGQEFVSFLRGDVQAQQKPKAEVRLITEPIPGQEFVSFGSLNGNVNTNDRDSVVSARDGEIFYINIDKPNNSTPEVIVAEPVPHAEPDAVASDTLDNEYYDYVDSATAHPNDYNYDDSTLVYDDISTTEAAILGDYPVQNNIEILTPNKNNDLDASPTAISGNELYGQYFDESDLAFKKGGDGEDKSLFPAESKVRSKFEIKEVNGQLYEYEYRYYYDDEAPEYDYDVVGDIPDGPAGNATAPLPSAPSAKVAVTTTTTTTEVPSTSAPITTAAPVAAASRGRTRGRVTAANSLPVRESAAVDSSPPLQENAIIQSNSRGRSRTRGQPLSQASSPAPAPAQGVLARTSSRAQATSASKISENSISVGESKLPTQTRFPPRNTTPAPQARSFGVPLFGDIPEQAIPIVHSKPFEVTTEWPVFDDVTTTVSPATRSLVNLYALAQAADAEEMETSTVFNDEQELGTIVPYDYLDAAYYDYDFGTEDSLLPPGITESSTVADYTDLTTTSIPTTRTTTTSTTTTTTTTTPEPTTTATTEAPLTRNRSRGSLRNAFAGGSSRSRFASRASTASNDDKSVATTTETSTTTNAPLPPRRGPNRLSPGASPARSSNRFRSFARTNVAAADEVQENASNKDTSVKSTTEQSTTVKESTPEPEKTNRFRPRPSFRSRTSAVTTTTEKPANKQANNKEESAAPKSRSRLFSRLQRGKRPGSKAAEETTEAAVEEGSDAQANEADANNNQEVASNQTISTTTSAPTTTAKGRRGSFGRGRINTRGSIRNSRLQVSTASAVEAEETPIEKAKETVNEEAGSEVVSDAEQSTTTQAPVRRGGVSRPQASSRLSARFNSRGRGRGRGEVESTTSTTIAPPEERESALAEEVAPDTPAVDGEAPVEEAAPEEPVEEETNGRRIPGRRAGVFGRFRNRVTNTEKAADKTTTTAAPAARRSSFSLMGNRRGRPGGRRGAAAEEETLEEPQPAPEEEVTPLEETSENELTAQGPQVELEAQGSEDLVSVAEQDVAVLTVVNPPTNEVPTVDEEPTSTQKPARISLLSRLRNKNRLNRS